METFVITYSEQTNGIDYSYDTTWKGENVLDALTTFLQSSDEDDLKRLSNIRIYKLIEVIIMTEELKMYMKNLGDKS